jgi:redox-sensitive bicupin YhaK (pirin superfamily)
MSNQGLIIEERSRDIGDFLVGRLLPFRKKRMVGPFIFIDHMGPSAMGPGRYLDVDQHPHIGLSTLTYLLEGEIEHQDSIGSRQRIKAGSVNWMTAGKGVVHTERTPAEWRDGRSFNLHGFQIWVALPDGKEDIDPSFHHFAAEDIPSWEKEGAYFKLIAGGAFGKKSPVPVHSEMFMLEVKTDQIIDFDSLSELKGEIGVCIVDGSVEACSEIIPKGNMLVSKAEDTCRLKISANSHLLIFGGEAFEEERHIYWNFVASSKEGIEVAKERWKNKAFPKVEGDDTYVPLPGA